MSCATRCVLPCFMVFTCEPCGAPTKHCGERTRRERRRRLKRQPSCLTEMTKALGMRMPLPLCLCPEPPRVIRMDRPTDPQLQKRTRLESLFFSIQILLFLRCRQQGCVAVARHSLSVRVYTDYSPSACRAPLAISQSPYRFFLCF